MGPGQSRTVQDSPGQSRTDALQKQFERDSSNKMFLKIQYFRKEMKEATSMEYNSKEMKELTNKLGAPIRRRPLPSYSTLVTALSTIRCSETKL